MYGLISARRVTLIAAPGPTFRCKVAVQPSSTPFRFSTVTSRAVSLRMRPATLSTRC